MCIRDSQCARSGLPARPGFLPDFLSDRQMKIAVIGGGWAGIAAAVELTAAGVATTLFEAGRVLGGRARSISVDGRTLDNGCLLYTSRCV